MGVRALVRRRGAVHETDDLAEVATTLEEDETAVAWIDFDGDPTPDEGRILEHELGIHALVIEDLIASYALPKLEEYETFLYVLVHGVARTSPLSLTDIGFDEVDIVLGERWVVTHHHAFAVIEQVRAECKKPRRILERGPAFVAHEILDRLVDDYLPAVESFDDELEALETAVIEQQATHESVARIFALKRSLFAVRRVAAYQREVLAKLGRPGTSLLPDAVLPFMRDVYDHLGQVTFLTETYRETASNVFEMHLSMQSNRLNEVMKTLTMFSTTLLPLSLVAGIYGMNFKNMPELEWLYGYPMAIGLMVVIGAGMLVFFRRKRWL